jgi:hypothetical protein
MPRILKKLRIRSVDTVDKGAGAGCQIAIRKRADGGDGHEFKIIVHKDAAGRGTLQMGEDFRAMAQYLGVKPGKLLKALNAPAPKPAPKPKPAPSPAQSFNKLMGITPMKPQPSPVRETFYATLCKYAAASARPNETAEQAFARVATTDPRGVDLMTAAKAADVTSNRINFRPAALPKEPKVPVLDPASMRTADVPPATPAPGGGGYGQLMALAYAYQAETGCSIEQAFAIMAEQNRDLFAMAKAAGPLFADPEDEEADDEAEPDDDPDDPEAALHKLRDGILAKHPTMHPGVALEKAMSKPAGRKHYAKYRDGVLGKRR